MRNRLLALACAGLVLATATAPAALAATATAPAGQAVTIDDRGSIVSAELLARMPAEQVAAYLTEARFPVPARPQGADLYAVVYRTISAAGTPTTASGVVALPSRSRKGLWTVSYAHGTMATRADAGSVADGDGGRRR